jgi:2-keto-4-pentenoate hydratase/2-oxohepta-3-ene-1,7-dioic acid hydratase in catechol pathway
VTAPEDLSQLGLELVVDDALRQKGDVSLMLYPPDVILKELHQFLVLEDFDIVMTGTPAGVGAVQAGERFCGRVCMASRNWSVARGWRSKVDEFSVSVIVTRWLFQ